MVLNLSKVIGQTIGVKLVMRLSYVTKFKIVLVPLIFMMVLFPVIIEYPSEHLAWILAIVFQVFMGKL